MAKIKSYPFKVWSGLLEDGHVQKIENALWEFLWCLNRVTLEKAGEGIVLGGKPIQIKDIATTLKRPYWTVYRHMHRLEKENYIKMAKTPYGLSIKVNKSKKWRVPVLPPKATPVLPPVQTVLPPVQTVLPLEAKTKKIVHDSKGLVSTYEKELLAKFPFLTDKNFSEIWNDWLEVRKKLRAPNTKKALELNLKKLHKLPLTLQEAIKMVEQSVERGWRGIFEVKNNETKDIPIGGTILR